MTIIKINEYLVIPFWTAYLWQCGVVNIKEEYIAWIHQAMLEEYNKRLQWWYKETGDFIYQFSL